MKYILALFLGFLSGCNSTPTHNGESHIRYVENNQNLHDLYLSQNIDRLEILLRADIWLLDQHKKCAILTETEAQTLQNRIALISSMIKIIKTVKK